MKKILAFILAALTVFSTVGYAAPTAEVTETGEEIAETGAFEVSSGDKAVLSEEEIDYNAPFYGVKVFFEDFENGYTDGESIIGKTTADGKATWALNGNNKISALAETDETTGNHYVRLVIPSGYVIRQALQRFSQPLPKENPLRFIQISSCQTTMRPAIHIWDTFSTARPDVQTRHTTTHLRGNLLTAGTHAIRA